MKAIRTHNAVIWSVLPLLGNPYLFRVLIKMNALKVTYKNGKNVIFKDPSTYFYHLYSVSDSINEIIRDTGFSVATFRSSVASHVFFHDVQPAFRAG